MTPVRKYSVDPQYFNGFLDAIIKEPHNALHSEMFSNYLHDAHKPALAAAIQLALLKNPTDTGLKNPSLYHYRENVEDHDIFSQPWNLDAFGLHDAPTLELTAFRHAPGVFPGWDGRPSRAGYFVTYTIDHPRGREATHALAQKLLAEGGVRASGFLGQMFPDLTDLKQEPYAEKSRVNRVEDTQQLARSGQPRRYAADVPPPYESVIINHPQAVAEHATIQDAIARVDKHIESAPPASGRYGELSREGFYVDHNPQGRGGPRYVVGSISHAERWPAEDALFHLACLTHPLLHPYGQIPAGSDDYVNMRKSIILSGKPVNFGILADWLMENTEQGEHNTLAREIHRILQSKGLRYSRAAKPRRYAIDQDLVDSLLQQIRADRFNPTIPLVLADHLEEEGMPAHADVIRRHVHNFVEKTKPEVLAQRAAKDVILTTWFRRMVHDIDRRGVPDVRAAWEDVQRNPANPEAVEAMAALMDQYHYDLSARSIRDRMDPRVLFDESRSSAAGAVNGPHSEFARNPGKRWMAEGTHAETGHTSLGVASNTGNTDLWWYAKYPDAEARHQAKALLEEGSIPHPTLRYDVVPGVVREHEENEARKKLEAEHRAALDEKMRGGSPESKEAIQADGNSLERGQRRQGSRQSAVAGGSQNQIQSSPAACRLPPAARQLPTERPRRYALQPEDLRGFLERIVDEPTNHFHSEMLSNFLYDEGMPGLAAAVQLGLKVRDPFITHYGDSDATHPIWSVPSMIMMHGDPNNGWPAEEGPLAEVAFHLHNQPNVTGLKAVSGRWINFHFRHPPPHAYEGMRDLIGGMIRDGAYPFQDVGQVFPGLRVQDVRDRFHPPRDPNDWGPEDTNPGPTRRSRAATTRGAEASNSPSRPPRQYAGVRQPADPSADYNKMLVDAVAKTHGPDHPFVQQLGGLDPYASAARASRRDPDLTHETMLNLADILANRKNKDRPLANPRGYLNKMVFIAAIPAKTGLSFRELGDRFNARKAQADPRQFGYLATRYLEQAGSSGLGKKDLMAKIRIPAPHVEQLVAHMKQNGWIKEVPYQSKNGPAVRYFHPSVQEPVPPAAEFNTKRQQIADLVTQGHGAKRIAALTGHPLGTVKNTLRALRKPQQMSRHYAATDQRHGSFLAALSLVKSTNQNLRSQVAKDIVTTLQLLPTYGRDVVHDSPLGTQPGMTLRIDSADRPKVDYAAAWLALLTKVPGVVAFHVGAGDDLLHSFDTRHPAQTVRKELDRVGVADRTVQPIKGGFRVSVFDRGGSLGTALQQAAGRLGTKVRSVGGQGSFLGTGEPGTYREALRGTIRGYEQEVGSRRAAVGSQEGNANASVQ